ncbi:MAG: hypothetical protein U0841_33815 [Chloroflexia bacterium]
MCGEIYNSRPLAATNFSITVELLGETGQVIASGQANATASTSSNLVKKTVWSAPIPNGPTTWSEARFRVQSGPVTGGVPYAITSPKG